MNRILARSLGALNGIIAILIVIVGMLAGLHGAMGSPIGLVLGGLAGFLIAALTCGIIAYLALIEKHLAALAGNADSAGRPRHPDPGP